VYFFFVPRPPKKTPQPLPRIDVPIGKRIAHYRKLRGFSQQALADEMGISQRQIATFTTGGTLKSLSVGGPVLGEVFVAQE
jgi:ribosome-binding protein aMBF1 (putative translation factor)